MNFLPLLGKNAGTSNACFGTGVYIPMKLKQSGIDLRCGVIFVSDRSNGRAQVPGRVHWRTHTCSPLTKQLGVFAVWGLVLLSASHNDPCTVCVCTASNSNSPSFRHFAIQARIQVCYCWRLTETEKVWPQVALTKHRPSSLRNPLESQKSTWYNSARIFSSTSW